MLATIMMQEIQALKLQNYTVPEIRERLAKTMDKPPSLPTIRKYFNMDVLPDNPGEKLQKDKAFDVEPFRSAIIEILRNNTSNKNLCISSVYDVLEEKFIENGDFKALPGNEQTLRNYVRYLRENSIIEATPRNARIYDHVFDTPPGEQMLIDFGQTYTRDGKDVFFICMLLRYSRYLVVYAQDHKYNSAEACRALYRGFCRLGGRPKELVIDQDAVFVSSETYGEVIKTQVFDDFCSEQDLKLWVCHKADPESKGPVENSVGFVKKNFFSARTLEDIEAVWKSLPGWLSRKNSRVHQSTYCVPDKVFHDIEQKALQPMVPSFYEDNPTSYTRTVLNGMPYIQYRTNKYSVPRSCAYSTLLYKAAGGYLYVYDENRRFICKHVISDLKGHTFRLEEHRKEEATDWLPIVERMRTKWNCLDFQHFINGVKKENPRYLKEQFGAIEEFLDKQNPSRQLVADVMNVCCRDYRYRFSQFQKTYLAVQQGLIHPDAIKAKDVSTASMGAYKEAFRRRCGQEVS